jgi:hypothetical protein
MMCIFALLLTQVLMESALFGKDVSKEFIIWLSLGPK